MSELIGSGEYGCVYRPALDCKKKFVSENTVSKLMSETNVLTEITESNTIDRIDPKGKFHIAYIHTCKVKERPKDVCARDDMTDLIIYPYGGIDLLDVIQYPIEDPLKFIRNIVNLFRGVYEMVKNDFYHFDIKLDNILMLKSFHSHKFRYIDFGLAKQVLETKDFECDFLGKVHFHWPIEVYMLSTLERIDIPKISYEYLYDTYNLETLEFYGKMTKKKELEFSNNIESLYNIKDYRRIILDKIDIFSLGVTLLELFRVSNIEKVIPKLLYRDIIKLLRKMITINTMDRISAKHAYIEYSFILKHYNIL